MESSYTKQVTFYNYREIPIDNTQSSPNACMNPIVSFQKKSFDLEKELVLLKNKSRPKTHLPNNPNNIKRPKHCPSWLMPAVKPGIYQPWTLSSKKAHTGA